MYTQTHTHTYTQTTKNTMRKTKAQKPNTNSHTIKKNGYKNIYIHTNKNKLLLKKQEKVYNSHKL